MMSSQVRNLLSIMGLFSFLFGSSKAQSQTPDAAKDPASAGRELRQMMLTSKPAEHGFKPSKDFPRVYGILMDFPIGKGTHTATIFAASDGSASLYTTSTFGVIGGVGHAAVRAAAVHFVRAADRLFDTAKLTTAYPYPAPDHLRFYLLTYEGVRVIETDMASAADGKSQYSEFFNLGQEVLTQLRLVTEKSE